jgi:hypothetical protein
LDHAYAIHIGSVQKTPVFFIGGNHKGDLVSAPGKFTRDQAGPIGRPPPSMMDNQKNAHRQLSFKRVMNDMAPHTSRHIALQFGSQAGGNRCVAGLSITNLRLAILFTALSND